MCKQQNNLEKHVCVYCGREATHQFKNGKWCCATNMNRCPAIRQKRIDNTKQQWQLIHESGYSTKEQMYKVIGSIYNKYKNTDKCNPGICYYCGALAQYQLKNGRWCCHQFYSQCPALRKKNSNSVKTAYATGKLDAKLIYQNKSQQSKKHMSWSKGLTKQTNQILKQRGQRLHQHYASGQLVHSWTGKKHTKEQIDKIIEGMIHSRKLSNGKTTGFKHGWYKGYWCDSSWQLAYVIYNLQHDIKFERNMQGFEYIFEDVKHLYYPDFILQDGTYIEIKGWVNDKTLAKIQQFPKELTLKMLQKKDMQIYLDYVKQKYGQNFISLYQI